MMRITRTLVTVCCVALAAFLGTGAFGQLSPNIGPKEPVSTQPSVNLTMADRHVLKEILLAQSTAKQDSAQVDLELGRIVPAAVHLYVFPENVTRKVPRVRSYEFFVVEDVIVLVRPRDRMIVELVK
jgi:hypothetical protein